MDIGADEGRWNDRGFRRRGSRSRNKVLTFTKSIDLRTIHPRKQTLPATILLDPLAGCTWQMIRDDVDQAIRDIRSEAE